MKYAEALFDAVARPASVGDRGNMTPEDMS